MAIPTDTKDQAIYHTILSELHRLQGIILNLKVINAPGTEQAVSEHFVRERGLTLGKLGEWRQRRPEVYQQASDDFQNQIQRA